MFSNSVPIDNSGKILLAAQPQNVQIPTSTAVSSVAPAAVTFPADVVQVSLGARSVQRSVDQATQPSVSGAIRGAVSDNVQDFAQIREAIAELQKKTTAVTFDLSEDPNHIVVKIVNSSTGEVVRQLPPKEMLQLAKRMEALRGMLFEKTS